MPTQPPHHVPSQESQNPGSLKVYQSLSRRAGNLPGHIMQNEPNLHRGGPVENQKCKTNPISRATTAPTTKKYETNPIFVPDYAKRTQFPRTAGVSPAFPPGIPRNEPNSRIPGVPPPPVSAKRTQFTPTPACPTTQKYETNPITRTGDSRTAPTTRNEPNFACPTPRQHPKNTKRTQFSSPVMQNEPNFPYRWRLAGLSLAGFSILWKRN